MNRLCNHDYDVIYQGLSQALWHAKKCDYIDKVGESSLMELLEMAGDVLCELSKIETQEENSNELS